MKKTLLLLSTLFIFSLGFQYALADNFSGLKVGSRSEEVKNLQEILKDDSTIYPEGLITGYFGLMTEKAIRKIQAKCGSPETGVIDQKARAVVTEIGGGGSGTYSRRAFRRLTQKCMERF